MDKKKIGLSATIFLWCRKVYNTFLTTARRASFRAENRNRLSLKAIFLIIVFVFFAIGGLKTTALKADTADSDVGPGGQEDVFGRDPFVRGANPMAQRSRMTKDAEITNILLTGIVYDNQDPAESYCLINEQAVKPGEQIEGFVLVDIQKDFVVLKNQKEDKEYKLSVWGE